MGYINGCRTANGGVIERIGNVDVELLSHKFHNPHCNIICYYFCENGVKIEVTYFKYIDKNEDGYEVYFFKGSQEVQHYSSRRYTTKSLPKKYAKIAEMLKEKFSMINFDYYTSRPKVGIK